MSSFRLMSAVVALACLTPLSAEAALPGSPKLDFPLACVIGRTCEIQHYVDRDPGPGVRDYRCGVQTYQAHNGVDIRVPDMAAQRRGVDVLAAATGRVARVRDGVADISVRALGVPSVSNQECGNAVVIDHGLGWETQYCHMARGSVRVKPGDVVAAGAPVGQVGLSGNTEYPHLHFTVRQNGTVVDPFAPGSDAGCAAQADIWTPTARAKMTYKVGSVLNAGFAGGPVTQDQVETGGITPPGRGAAAVVAYVRAIGLQAGDEIELELKGPDGASLAHSRAPPLDRWKAQWLTYVGKKTPAAGWPGGIYAAEYRILRRGKVAISRRVEVRL